MNHLSMDRILSHFGLGTEHLTAAGEVPMPATRIVRSRGTRDSTDAVLILSLPNGLGS